MYDSFLYCLHVIEVTIEIATSAGFFYNMDNFLGVTVARGEIK